MDLSKETIQKSLLKFGVPPADLLVKYVALLMETNEMVNLTGAKTVDDFVLKHISDVWLAFKSIDGLSRPLIDVGSGGGLPGIPMAIFSPNTEVFLVERRVKKAMATESIVKGLGLQGRITVIPEALEIAKNKLPEEGECWLRGFLPGGKLATYLDEFFNPNTF